MISLVDLPSARLLSTYSAVRGSDLILPATIMCRALLARLSPPRLRRNLSVFPLLAGTGAAPQSIANAPSERSLPGFSPAATTSLAALTAPQLGTAAHRALEGVGLRAGGLPGAPEGQQRPFHGRRVPLRERRAPPHHLRLRQALPPAPLRLGGAARHGQRRVARGHAGPDAPLARVEQGPQALDPAAAQLGHGGALSGEHVAGGALCVAGVVLPLARPPGRPLGPQHLEHAVAPGGQLVRELRPVGAGALHAHRGAAGRVPNRVGERGAPLRRGVELARQRDPAPPVQHAQPVRVGVRVDARDDLPLELLVREPDSG